MPAYISVDEALNWAKVPATQWPCVDCDITVGWVEVVTDDNYGNEREGERWVDCFVPDYCDQYSKDTPHFCEDCCPPDNADPHPSAPVPCMWCGAVFQPYVIDNHEQECGA